MSPPPPTARETPLVSVVTIFLDAERFLDDAVRSVLAQTYSHWELVLVDDGSTDGSSALARAWAERHPERVRYVAHEGHANRGMSVSRNLGVLHARGSVIALLDADDVYLPRKLEHQLSLLAARPEVGMVYGATQYWYGWTGAAEDLARDRTRRQGVASGVVLAPGALLPALVRDEARTPCTCGVLIRREAWDAVGGFDERFRGMFEDQVFFYKILSRVPVLVDGECHDRYRQHPASHCRVERERGGWDGEGRPADSHRAFVAWLSEFVAGEGLARDPALRAALRRAKWPYRSVVHAFVQRTTHGARQLVRSLARRLGAR
jgi:glycosyltransferase involved in cell wall biosynthesis